MDNSSILVLVTGATGYLASHVTQQLLEKGYKERGTTRDLKNDCKVKPLQELQPQQNLELVEAELLDASSWIPAVEGCQFVIHVASPLPFEPPRDENVVIKPAVEGTLSILRACVAAKTVQRVVMTSSVAAVSQAFELGGKFDESDWTDPTKPDLDPYIKSKTLAERAAWEFVENLQEVKFELAVINPGMILGPVIVNRLSQTMDIPRRLLEKEALLIPNLTFSAIDVRDVATAHIQAMLIPEAAGHRHICSNVNIDFKEIAEMLAAEFGPYGYNVTTTRAPDFLVRLSGICDKSVLLLTKSLSKMTFLDNTRMLQVLGITPRPVSDTVLSMAHTMIVRGQIDSNYSSCCHCPCSRHTHPCE